MNYCYNNNKQLFSLLLAILLNSSLYAITVNNRPLNDIVAPGYDFILPNPIKESIIFLEMENDNLNIKYVSEFPKDKLLEFFKEIRIDPFHREEGNIFRVISYKNARIAKKSINFESKILLNFSDCLLESPCVSMVGNRMVFNNCYLMNTQSLYLSTNDLDSNYEFIEILFDNSSKIPTVISGHVDFLNNPNRKILYLANVKQIRIRFRPQAWDNNSSEDSETNPESIAQKNTVQENVVQYDSSFSQLTQQCFERVKQFFSK